MKAWHNYPHVVMDKGVKVLNHSSTFPSNKYDNNWVIIDSFIILKLEARCETSWQCSYKIFHVPSYLGKTLNAAKEISGEPMGTTIGWLLI